MNQEAMLRELMDREQIKELTYAYGLAIENQDAEKITSLFTSDGFVDFSSMGRGVIKGHDAIKDFYPATWPLRVRPFFSNHIIKVAGDEASGTCSLENRAVRDGESIIGAGRLHDQYRRVNGEWKFASRRVEMFYFVPLSQGWATSDGLGKL